LLQTDLTTEENISDHKLLVLFLRDNNIVFRAHSQFFPIQCNPLMVFL